MRVRNTYYIVRNGTYLNIVRAPGSGTIQLAEWPERRGVVCGGRPREEHYVFLGHYSGTERSGILVISSDFEKLFDELIKLRRR